MTDKPPFYGWKLVAVLFFLVFFNMGFPYYGGSVINGYMIHEIPMSRSTLGLGFTLINLFVGLASVFVAISILKCGVRATFIAGSALFCLGSLFLALYASKPWHYLIAFGVINGIGISFSTLFTAATAVTRWFRRYRGRAMGIALSAPGFAGFAVSPFLDKMLRTAGGNWRVGWEIVAGAGIISGLLAFLFVKESPQSLGQTVDGIPAEEQNRPSRTDALATTYPWTASQAYRTPAYWLIAIGGVATTFPFFFFVAHWILRLRGAGISSANAAWAMSLFTIGTIGGHWLGGLLMDILESRLVFVIGLSIYFLASYLAIIVRSDTLTVAYAAAVAYGLAVGWALTCQTTILAHYYGPAAFPKLNGVMTLLTSVCASPAGYVGGKIFDLYGSYTRAFELNCAMVAIGIVALAFAVRPRPRNEIGTPTVHIPNDLPAQTAEKPFATRGIRRQKMKIKTKINDKCAQTYPTLVGQASGVCQ
ncbi:MAG TPA: MFS transporter [Candidatus Acidoferrales bacterium]|jgi:MFS family permease|nr:MFS transporter [Candidatus Acidoferrales bacterium]